MASDRVSTRRHSLFAVLIVFAGQIRFMTAEDYLLRFLFVGEIDLRICLLEVGHALAGDRSDVGRVGNVVCFS